MKYYPYKSVSEIAKVLGKTDILLFSTERDPDKVTCPFSKQKGEVKALEQVHLIVPHEDGRFTGLVNIQKPPIRLELIHQTETSFHEREKQPKNMSTVPGVCTEYRSLVLYNKTAEDPIPFTVLEDESS